MTSPYASFAAAKAAFPNMASVDVPPGDNFTVVGQDWLIGANTVSRLRTVTRGRTAGA